MANVKDTQNIFSALLESRKNKASAVKRVIESKAKKTENVDLAGFTGRLLKESLNEDVTDDIIDNIAVVTDPDKTVKELETRADDIQDAIDNTPEGEAAFSDEYVGDKVYACPVCGESFFADEEYKDGDICPICKAEPQDGFLMQGVVAPAEPEDDLESEEIESEYETAEVIPEESEEPAEGEDEAKEESYKKESANTISPDIKGYKARILDLMVKRTPAGKNEYVKNLDKVKVTDFNKLHDAGVAPEDIKAAFPGTNKIEVVDTRDNKYEIAIQDIHESKKVCRECDEPAIEIEIDLKDDEIEIKKPKELDVELDEKSFEDNLNQFADENYKGSVKNISINDASFDPVKDELCLNCVAECTNGAKAPLSFVLKEARALNNRAVLKGYERNNTFKVESKAPAFSFVVRNTGKALRCESMKYNFITTHSKAGKVKVEGFCKSYR